MAYVDGFVVPVPKKNLQAYRRLARKAGKSGLVSGGAGIARAEQREENGDGQGNAGRSKKRRNQASACPANVPGAFCRDVEPERAGGAHRRRLQRREPRDCPCPPAAMCAPGSSTRLPWDSPGGSYHPFVAATWSLCTSPMPRLSRLPEVTWRIT
jgi:Protein of unknown function (DUF1428)